MGLGRLNVIPCKLYLNIIYTMDNITNKLKQIYKDKTYLNEYGGSVFITFITLIIFFVLISYFQVMNHTKPIKDNWIKERCNPMVIPFAGLINKDPHLSTAEFTGKNFTNCTTNILINIVHDFLKPIGYVADIIKNSVKDVSKDINMVRKKISDMLGEIADIDKEIMGRILNFLMPLHLMMIKIKDILMKSQAGLITTLYSVIGAYLGLKTFVGAFISILIAGLIILTGIIVVLLIFFFTIPLAIPLLIVYTAVAVPLVIIIAEMSKILHMTKASVPPKPRCFDKNTKIKKKDGSICKISNIKLGDELINGAIVTAVCKLSTHDITMYNYNNIIVSGNHNILTKDGIWKPINKLYLSKKIEYYTEPYIHCLNTTTKTIPIENSIFADWDDIDEMEIFDIKQMYFKTNLDDVIFGKSNIHKYLDGGFIGNTQIELDDGRSINIQDIEVNDVLRFGERVLGKVEIDAKKLKVAKYLIDDKEFICGPNNFINDELAGYISTMRLEGKKITDNKPTKLYHLITDKHTIIIDGVEFSDYDGCLEHLLNNIYIKLHSTKFII